MAIQEIDLLRVCEDALFYLDRGAIQTAVDLLKAAIDKAQGVEALIDQEEMAESSPPSPNPFPPPVRRVAAAGVDKRVIDRG